MKLSFPLLLLMAAGWSLPLLAQVATAPLDSSLEIRMPQAASWRFVKAGNEQDDNRTATLAGVTFNGKGESDNQQTDWETSGKSFLLIAQTENVNIEAYNRTSLKTTINFQAYDCTRVDDIPLCGTGKVTQDRVENRLGFSLKAKGASYGASYNTEEFSWANSSPYKRQSYALGGTWQFGKVLFASLGLERVTQSNLYLPTLNWNNQIWAFGVMAGNPEETQLRLEYAGITSPEKNKTDDLGRTQRHQGEQKSLLSAEVKMQGILLHFRKETTRYLTATYWGEQSRSRSIMGLGWAPSNGIIASAQAYTDHYQISTSQPDQVAKSLRLSVGYNF